MPPSTSGSAPSRSGPTRKSTNPGLSCPSTCAGPASWTRSRRGQPVLRLDVVFICITVGIVAWLFLGNIVGFDKTPWPLLLTILNLPQLSIMISLQVSANRSQAASDRRAIADHETLIALHEMAKQQLDILNGQDRVAGHLEQLRQPRHARPPGPHPGLRRRDPGQGQRHRREQLSEPTARGPVQAGGVQRRRLRGRYHPPGAQPRRGRAQHARPPEPDPAAPARRSGRRSRPTW